MRTYKAMKSITALQPSTNIRFRRGNTIFTKRFGSGIGGRRAIFTPPLNACEKGYSLGVGQGGIQALIEEFGEGRRPSRAPPAGTEA